MPAWTNFSLNSRGSERAKDERDMMTAWPTLNLAAGPVDVSQRTLRDMARPVLHFEDPVFVEIYDHTCIMLQELFQTKNDVVIMHGEAMLAIEAAAASLI